MDSLPERPRPKNWPDLTPEQRAGWYLEQISDDDPVWAALARLLLSAAKNRGNPQRPAPKPPARLRAPRRTPSRLAKWEAQWQAEQSAEAER
jgi:hypothetical protein